MRAGQHGRIPGSDIRAFVKRERYDDLWVDHGEDGVSLRRWYGVFGTGW